MITENNPGGRPRVTTDLVLSILLGLLLIGGLISSIYVYFAARNFVAHSQLPIFPSTETAVREVEEEPTAQSNASTGVPEAGAEPVAAAPEEEQTLPAWNPAEAEAAASDEEGLPPPATERLTILVMGIDRRETETGPWRTDSMIVISVDPATTSVAMLSVPRDLYVTIPDYGYGEHLDRINTAYFHGDLQEYPGGGAALAKQTIRRNFGLEVDRYLVMDFDGFRQIIDYIGGIQIEVPERIVDTEYPTEDYGYMTVRFEPGLQTMDGETALIYSRTRKSTSDFARAARQQQVIMAVRDKVLSLDIIPSLTPVNLARIIQTLDQSIQTDMHPDEVLALAQVARGVQDENIHRFVIDSTMVNDYLTDQGAQVLIPKWDVVLPLTARTFGVELLPLRPGAKPPVTLQADNNAGESGITGEAAHVALLNGTDHEDLAKANAAELAREGFNITTVGSAEENNYERSQVLLYNQSMEETAEALRKHYGLSISDVHIMTGRNGIADIVVVLGKDTVD